VSELLLGQDELSFLEMVVTGVMLEVHYYFDELFVCDFKGHLNSTHDLIEEALSFFTLQFGLKQS
jgi:hypothetical protein